MVTYNAVAVNGGSPITSYELQMGSLNLNDFVTVSGLDPQTLTLYFTVTKGVEKGKTYTFRYRAVNAVGPSGWSPITEIIAATIPAAPPKPTYSASDSTTITLTFSPSTDNGGSKIIKYKLFRDGGDLSTGIITEVTLYNGIASSY